MKIEKIDNKMKIVGNLIYAMIIAMIMVLVGLILLGTAIFVSAEGSVKIILVIGGIAVIVTGIFTIVNTIKIRNNSIIINSDGTAEIEGKTYKISETDGAYVSNLKRELFDNHAAKEYKIGSFPRSRSSHRENCAVVFLSDEAGNEIKIILHNMPSKKKVAEINAFISAN